MEEKKEEMEERSVNIRYTENDGHFGVLRHADLNIEVCTHHAPQIADRQGLKVSHQNYLHSFFFDDDNEVMVHERYQDTLSNHIAELKIRSDPVLGYAIKDVKGQTVMVEKYVNPEFRLLLKSIVTFVVHQHLKRFALTTFNMDNIVYHEGDIKFVGVGLVEGSEQARKENFNSLYQMVIEIFDGFLDPIPMELDHWMGQIIQLKYERPDDGVLLLHHMMLMSPKESYLFFVSCNKTIETLVPHAFDEYKKALRKLGDRSRWSSEFKPGTYLDKCFRHKGANQYYLHNSRDAAHFSDVTEDMFRCCRNVAVHLNDHTPVKDIDIERMTMQVFGKVLVEFQVIREVIEANLQQ